MTHAAPGIAAAAWSRGSKTVMGWLYVGAYMLVGVAAAVTWVVDDHTPELLRSMASVWGGTLVAVAANYVTPKALR